LQNNLLILLTLPVLVGLPLKKQALVLWQHGSWGCEIVSLRADIQIISYSLWDYG